MSNVQLSNLSGSKNNQKCLSCFNNFKEIFGDSDNIIDCLSSKSIETIPTTIPMTDEPNTSFPTDESKTSFPTDEPKTSFPIDSSSIILPCGKNCEICDQLEGKCSKCFEGYYLPENDKSQLNCEKCSIENCKDENKCINCKNNFIPGYDENDKNLIISCNSPCKIGEDEQCKTCSEKGYDCGSCNTFYILEKGKCISEYTIKATYNSTSNKNVKIISDYFREKVKAKMLINGEITEIHLSNNYFQFDKEDENTVYLYLE